VALAILAVVTALVLPKFLDVRKQSVLAVADKNLAELNAVYQQWYTLGGRPNGLPPPKSLLFWEQPGILIEPTEA
jgi:type II secretory pathway pseudopilin PulG